MAFGASSLLPALLAACAARVDLPALPSSHPAHPAAAAAEPIRPSDLLERAAPVRAAEPAAPGGHDHHSQGTPEPLPPALPATSPPPEAHEHEANEQAPGEHEPGEHEGQKPSSNEPAADPHEHRHDPPTPPTERR